MSFSLKPRKKCITNAYGDEEHLLLIVGIAFTQEVQDVNFQHCGLSILVHVLDNLKGDSRVPKKTSTRPIKIRTSERRH